MIYDGRRRVCGRPIIITWREGMIVGYKGAGIGSGPVKWRKNEFEGFVICKSHSIYTVCFACGCADQSIRRNLNIP